MEWDGEMRKEKGLGQVGRYLSMIGRWMQVQDTMAGNFHVLGCNCELTVSFGSRNGFKMYRGDIRKVDFGGSRSIKYTSTPYNHLIVSGELDKTRFRAKKSLIFVLYLYRSDVVIQLH